MNHKQDKLNNGIFVYLGGLSSSDILTNAFTNITISSITPYTLIHLNTSYYAAGRPNYGGITLSVAQLRYYSAEPLVVTIYDNSYRFLIKYVNDTTLAVQFSGTQSVNKCLSIHAVL